MNSSIRNKLTGLVLMACALLVGCAASVPPAVGVWAVQLDTPLGALPATLTVNEDGTGTMAADGLGETAVSGITFDGNTMAFDTEVNAQGQTLFLEFNGTVDGDTMSGAFDSDFGAFGVTGTRM